MLIDYLATYPSDILRCHARNIIINIEADSDYLVLPKSISCAVAWFIFGDEP